MMRIFTNILLVLFPFILGAQNILYTMPAEDTPHESTWLQWPHNNTFPPFHISDNESTFVEITATAVEEHNTNNQLLQIVDVLGRKVKEDSKQLLFYIFENRSVEKKIQIID
tara:strand:- start:9318 stop:9653 length:336 start_codon:yes stop_codon:yes gene_type:complete